MKLSEIQGHSTAIRMLEGAKERGRLASSYLFAGEEGIGKRATALAFAAAINCKNPIPVQGGQDACGECGSCVKFAGGTHPDLLIVEPDGAQIKVEQVRQVGEALAYRSFEGGVKVVIVDNAEAMNPAASNAFLKTLEEPTPDTLIILVSSMPDRLLPTIRSRCSRINFRPLSDEDSAKVLEGLDISGVAVRLSMGRPGLAASEDLVAERDRFFDTLDLMLAGEEKPPWKDRSESERFLDSVMLLLRDMAASKGGSPDLMNEDMAPEITEMGTHAPLKRILESYERIRKLRGQLFFNLNRGITWNYTASLLEGLRLHG